MDRLLVHIGFHKTGSTWLQNHLFHSDSNSFISLSSNSNGPSTLAEKFIYDEQGYLLSPFETNEKNIHQSLNSILSEKSVQEQNSFYAISHERLSGNPHSSGFDASIIARRLYEVFPKAKILIVIREQKSWILSNYFQYLAKGGTHSLPKYLNTTYDGKRPGFSPCHICYHHIISFYYKTFGKNNVLVLPFEMFRSEKVIFIEKIESFLNHKIQLDKSDFNIYSNKKGNHFINYWMRFLNKLFRSSSLNNYSGFKNRQLQIFAYGTKEFLGLFVPNFINKLIKRNLSRKIKHWSGNRFKESNKITNDLISSDLKKYGYFD